MTAGWTRRHLLGGLLAGLGTAALGEAPAVSLRPVPRPGSVLPPGSETIIARAGLSGEVAFALADADTGAPIEAMEPDRAMQPASVTKAFTALYARDRLGPGHRFVTRILATGPVADGVLAGDLILAGGGDPVLNTDDLAAFAARLRGQGLRAVRGRFLVWGGALPFFHEIDAAQQPHLGYNPAVSGLNLNFNRVHFEWAPQGGDYRVSMDARSDNLRPDVAIARMRVADRDLPVYTYEDTGEVDSWTVARGALGEGGSRWLPVRKPALYAGEVFATLARAQGIDLPDAAEIADLPPAEELARRESAPLDDLLSDMLEFSTNLTAEVMGLSVAAAGGRRPVTLAESGALMADWAAARLGASARFVDHSGLGDGSAIGAGDLVRALVAAAPDGALMRLMKDIALVDRDGNPLANPPAVVRAKTGTLNFVSALGGYVVLPTGRRLAFAILSRDSERRAAARADDDEVPEGGREWLRRARALQQDLIQSWAARHAG